MSNTEQQIEQEIQDKGLNAPRLTPDLIDSKIKAIRYLTGDVAPACVFKDSYKENGHLSFSSAMEALKSGRKVARLGWNGKDQYVVAQAQATTTEASKIWNLHNKAHAEKLGGQIDVAPYCTLKTAQDTLAMGWTPSTGDLFANDWMVL